MKKTLWVWLVAWIALAGCADPARRHGSPPPDVGSDATDDRGTTAGIVDGGAADAEPADVPVDIVDVSQVESGDLACPTGQTRCGGQCVALAFDPAHCGACENACPVRANATATCAAGVCAMSCTPGFRDCDGDSSNGCEVDSNSNVMHCGTCGTVCPTMGATAVCVMGRCRVTTTTCQTGFGDCDRDEANGCEVDTRGDRRHCGRCGNVCEPPSGGSSTCTSGTCVDACPAGSVLDGRTCREVLPPRPIAPLSGENVTSRRPTLRWRLAASTTGARVDLCRDRAMTTGCAAMGVAATGENFRPSNPLTPGVYFWRLRGRADTTDGAMASAVWELYVGHGDVNRPTVDTSGGSFVDFNGDGYTDLAVASAGHMGTASLGFTVWLGGSAWSGSTPTGRVYAPPSGAGMHFGSGLAAGDFNGDGIADLAVGDGLGGSRVHVYAGSPSGLPEAMTALRVISRPPDVTGDFGGTLSAEDTNGDGYQDLLAGVYGAGPAGRLVGPAVAADASVLVPHNDPNYVITAPVHDLDGNGFNEVAIGAGTVSNPGVVRIYERGATGFPPSLRWTLTGTTTTGAFGGAIVGATR